MAVGDMKYKFTDNDGQIQELEIPATVLRSGKHRGLNNRQTIMEYAFKQGFNVDEPKIEKKNSNTKTKARSRKPNEVKRMIIDKIQDAIQDLGEINVLNSERQIQIEINGNLYEVTLVQKRKQS